MQLVFYFLICHCRILNLIYTSSSRISIHSMQNLNNNSPPFCFEFLPETCLHQAAHHLDLHKIDHLHNITCKSLKQWCNLAIGTTLVNISVALFSPSTLIRPTSFLSSISLIKWYLTLICLVLSW